MKKSRRNLRQSEHTRPTRRKSTLRYPRAELASQRGFEVVANDDCNLAIAISSGEAGLDARL